MPNRDGTGPAGKGPQTGRKQGKCCGINGSKPDVRTGQGFGRRRSE